MLAASVKRYARAQPVRQRAAREGILSRAKLPPSLLPPGPGACVGRSPGCFCWSPLLSNAPCWSPRHFLGAELLLQPPQQRCPWTPRSRLEVARAWSGCGEASRSH